MSAPTIDDRRVRVDLGDRSLRRRRRIRALILVLAGLVLAGVVWVVFFSSLLAVKSVRVVGAEGVQADQVIAAAQVALGTPLVRLDTAQAQAGVLTLPWVSGVEVRRGWPNEVVLAVTTRVPIAALTGSNQVVDAAGVTFDVLGVPPTSLPSVSAKGIGLETAMAVLAALPADIAARVVSVTASTRDDASLILRSGAEVRWGSSEQAEFKAEVLRALLRHKREVYDVTAPELPTTFKGN